ncbi:hypothetical protein [Sinorhizobium fredii]|uniref:hypothetical protein n=1 Tax=Rhizobium fredii TaxID=380 RepID=UPI0005956B18|nr:hypothetical protein [Sinorhizobium fredii]WOS65210.1 hypothetical protein SFGR64A_27120 [Sinorhizobium fredii GR64]
MTRFGGTELGEETDRTVRRRPADAGFAREVGDGERAIGALGPSSGRAIAARNAASLLAPSALMLRPLSGVR